MLFRSVLKIQNSKDIYICRERERVFMACTDFQTKVLNNVKHIDSQWIDYY